MSKPTDTPETNAILSQCNQRTCEVGIDDLIKMHGLARKLERERNAYREALKRISDMEDKDHGEPWTTLGSIGAIAHNALSSHE